uniref:Transcription factor IIIB 50 kDa subunit n=1 Tax=Periophthalmus magnuspinnatus TaxID=409849 RepID=A0A3B4AKG1_9GOBI
MSRVALKCPNCGSSNVVEDDLYAQSQSVCVDCGSVVSEGFLANDPVGEVYYSHSAPQSKRPCSNLIKGLQRVRALCRVLRVNSEIEKLSQTYFEQAYNHKSFINVSLTKKEALAGSCVLISCRMHDWPVTVGTIAYLIDTDSGAVGAVYQETLNTLNICIPTLTELAAEAKELTKRALALVELAADSWIVTGRRPVPIMIAATYLSWQSLQPTKLRLKMTLDKFCQMTKVDKNRPAMKRVTEIKEMLCKLGNEIPWEKQEITPNNVIQQVEDILSYRFALMRKALKSYEDSLKADIQQCDAKNKKTMRTKTAELKTSSKTGSSVLETERANNGACDEPNWGKRLLFAPPCVVNPKKRKRAPSNQINVTGDEEISDSEIDSYIRTHQEVREIAMTQKLLCQESDNL